MAVDTKKMAKRAASRGIGNQQKAEGYRRHILLCTGKSCGGDRSQGEETWKFLGKRLSRLKKEGVRFYRSEVDCLFICNGGPLAVVYPEGTWYHSVTPEVCARIVDEHLLHGRVVEEFVFALNPLKEENG